MENNNKATLEELTWKDIRAEFLQKNPTLTKIIDDLSPSKNHTLFRCKYPFGSEVLRDGLLYLPSPEGTVVPITSPQIHPDIQEKLGYNLGTNPVSMVLQNSTEIFMILETNTIPLYGLVTPGKLFGTWLVLGKKNLHTPIFLWSMTAGARSLFSLPKISKTAGYNKMKHLFHLKAEKPASLLDHWRLFKEIANHQEFGESWSLDIVYFSKKWFENLEDPAWSKFRMHLLDLAWNGSEFWRNQFIWNLIFSLIQRKRNIKPNPYIADTIKQLFAMGEGVLPGFAPAIDDLAGPISKLQEVLMNVYHLESYAPIIMQPHLFNDVDRRPIYYSLQYPTNIEFSPRSRDGATKIFDLYEIQSLLSKYLADIQSGGFNLEGTILNSLPEKVQYDFFHTDAGNYKDIRLSKDIPTEDPSFLNKFKDPNNAFPTNSPFVRGCVRIMAKNL